MSSFNNNGGHHYTQLSPINWTDILEDRASELTTVNWCSISFK